VDEDLEDKLAVNALAPASIPEMDDIIPTSEFNPGTAVEKENPVLPGEYTINDMAAPVAAAKKEPVVAPVDPNRPLANIDLADLPIPGIVEIGHADERAIRAKPAEEKTEPVTVASKAETKTIDQPATKAADKVEVPVEVASSESSENKITEIEIPPVPEEVSVAGEEKEAPAMPMPEEVAMAPQPEPAVASSANSNSIRQAAEEHLEEIIDANETASSTKAAVQDKPTASTVGNEVVAKAADTEPAAVEEAETAEDKAAVSMESIPAEPQIASIEMTDTVEKALIEMAIAEKTADLSVAAISEAKPEKAAETKVEEKIEDVKEVAAVTEPVEETVAVETEPQTDEIAAAGGETVIETAKAAPAQEEETAKVESEDDQVEMAAKKEEEEIEVAQESRARFSWGRFFSHESGSRRKSPLFSTDPYDSE
ncbi:MAG: hypothetical protein JXR97_06280, partial [Planctomycetes bacterium]|nr:hypothetical protein [Planctomycetota bacterium]